MIFSPQEYRNKLINMILSHAFLVILPIVIVAIAWFSSVPLEVRQVIVFGVAVVAFYAQLRTLRPDIKKFKDVSMRKKYVQRLNAVVDNLFNELPAGVTTTSIEFVNDTSVGIIKRDGYYQIDMHQNGVVEYILKPDGLRSTQNLSVRPDEVDRLIGEIELEAQYLSRRLHQLPLRAGL